jgi:UDP-N-acetylmuramate dehydrogenase
MNIQENVSLRAMHTFHVSAKARYFARFSSAEDLFNIPSDKGPVLLLGGGSNILFLNDYPGLVLKNEIKGITLLHEDPEYVYIRAGAGENWHELVMYTVEKGWGGLENLSLIPGCVGAAPIQNIGAYGVELEDTFWDLEAFHFADKKRVTFTKSDCSFGYRDSVFKNKYKGQFAILYVTFRLRKHPVFHTSYGALQQQLEKRGVKELTLKEVAHAVMQIRSSKLPDPEKVGSAGSFFKNPAISKEAYEQLLKMFPGMPSFSQPEGKVKIPAGWLIEYCGWKGYRKGDAGCFPLQALVLVNYGNASGSEIKAIADAIRSDVQQKFAITLEPEVNII